jgi:hypothetical protein
VSVLPPVRLQVWSPAFEPMFSIGDPLSITVTPRHLALGTAELVLPLDHHRVPALMATTGCRLTVGYFTGRPADDYTDPANWLQVLSGPIWTRKAEGPTAQGTVTFGAEDDFRVLSGVTAWPTPASAISSQTSAYDKRTGTAEAVIKAYVTANAVTRLGLPITVATNLGRGAATTKSARFESLTDLLTPVAQLAGLGIRVHQNGSAGLVLDVYEPADRTARVLSESAGTITAWSFSSTGPASTRQIIGGQGELTARQFRQRVATARESEWATRIEQFTDARNADTTAGLDQDGDENLADTAPTAGVTVTVAETDVVRYGRNLFVGDRVAVRITPNLVVEDILSAATITWSAADGLTVEPAVGDAGSESSDAVLVNSLRRAFAGIRYLRASK